jgi:hypothetical protein
VHSVSINWLFSLSSTSVSTAVNKDSSSGVLSNQLLLSKLQKMNYDHFSSFLHISADTLPVRPVHYNTL